MPILSTNFNDIGNAGQVPSIIRIQTNDSLPTVLSLGYLDILAHEKLPLSENSIALVSTGTGANQSTVLLAIVFSNGHWSLEVMEGYEPTGGGQGISFVNVPGTSQLAVDNFGYIIGNSSQTTITLPSVAAVGAIVAVQGNGTGGWILRPGVGQTIKVGQTSASTSITSAAQYDAIQVVCVVANTTWTTSYLISSGVTIA